MPVISRSMPPFASRPAATGLRGALRAGAALAILAGQPAWAAETGAVGTGARPDLRALQHFERQGDPARVKAEKARLMRLHPGWTPPLRSLDDGGEDALWALLAEDRTAALRAALAERREDSRPSPSAALTRALERREARARALNAAAIGHWRAVLTAAARAGERAGSDGEPDVELMWATGRAEAGLGDAPAARHTLRHAWEHARDADARAGTVHHALAALGPAETADLLAAASPAPAEAPRLEAMVARRALSAGATDADGPALAALFVRFERRTREAGAEAWKDAASLGWAALDADRPAEAAPWFAQALTTKASPEAARHKALEGRILALARTGRADEAEALAGEHAGASEALAALHLGFLAETLGRVEAGALPAERLNAMAASVSDARSDAGAEALGWYAYRTRLPAPAAAWFRTAIDWRGEAGPKDAAYGLALALRAGGDRPGAEEVKRAHAASVPQLASLDLSATRTGPVRPGLRARITRALADGRIADCLSLAARLGGDRAKDAEIEGWCLKRAGRLTDAARAFETALSRPGGDRAAASRGLVWSHLKREATDRAAQLAARLPLDAASRREIDVEIWTQRARAAADRGRHADTVAALDRRAQLAAEPRDLALMRGWSLYHLGRRHAARRVFETADRALSTRDSRRALAQIRRR